MLVQSTEALAQSGAPGPECLRGGGKDNPARDAQILVYDATPYGTQRGGVATEAGDHEVDYRV